jgi:predicted dehydrogenase
MSKAHSMAYAAMPMFFWPAPAIPVRAILADINDKTAAEAAARFGYERSTGDWRTIIADPSIDIVDIATPNNSHAEIALAAAQAGKHILCEKPIARTTEEALQMLEAVRKAGVTNMLAFNYRKTPAIAYAKKLIQEGEIGPIRNFRATYLQDWSADPNAPLSWRFQKDVAGSGALGDIGTHVIDIARYLVSDIAEVSSLVKTYIGERPVQAAGLDALGTVKMAGSAQKGIVDVDDEITTLLKFDNGAIGSLEATRNAWGRNNFITLEIHGEIGSIYFNYERRDELQVCFANDPADRKGFRTIYTGPAHPNGAALWPIPALGIGYGETKIIECYDFFDAVVNHKRCEPDFEDGYRISQICDAILQSAATSQWTKTRG